MENLSRESTILSQDTMEAVMNLTGANGLEFNELFKSEFMAVDCLQQSDSFNIAVEQTLFQDQPLLNYNIIEQPDSTEGSKMSPDFQPPVSTGRQPSTENYPGPCDFDIELSKLSSDKAKWEHSKLLNKLFVVMDCKIPMKFKWSQSEYGLFVRVLPVFLAQDSFSEPVMRCPTHLSGVEKSNKDFPHVEHIVRSHHENAMYDKNSESGRLSVVFPLECPQPGSEWSTVVLSFMCKNSCGLGMNRRSTALIFTLERPNNQVIGRKVLNMRICSCPRRDMQKEEEVYRKKENDESVTPVTTEMRDVQNAAKKPLKRLSRELLHFKIRVPKTVRKSVVKTIKEMMLMLACDRDLSPEDKITIQDCEKYLP